ncbi:MAG TPA: retropepsin-like aspartic protease, partial [Gemmataceae bacterium]|nr:retropepsin-like aspartic protease [Gemmataceae bacterium]
MNWPRKYTRVLSMRTVTVFASFTVILSATGAEPPRSSGDDLAGKFVSIFVADSAQNNILQDVRIQTIGRRAFLVGNQVRKLAPDLPVVRLWYPVADIKCLHVFKSFEDAEKSYPPGWSQPAKGVDRNDKGNPPEDLDRPLRNQGYAVVPLAPTRSGYLIVTASIKQKTIRLLVDTGCGRSCLDESRTKGVGIDWAVGGSPGRPDSGGTGDKKTCLIEAVELGPFTAHGVKFVTQD